MAGRGPGRRQRRWVLLEEVVGSTAGMARLHDEVFDAVLVSHEPEELDALDLIEGYRTSGADEPMIVLGRRGEQEMAACATRSALMAMSASLHHHAAT